MKVSVHARQQISSRLSSLISVGEVENACAGIDAKIGQTWLLLKRLPKQVSLPRHSHGGNVNGDTVWLVINRSCSSDPGAVSTVMVRRWAQPIKADHVIR